MTMLPLIKDNSMEAVKMFDLLIQHSNVALGYVCSICCILYTVYIKVTFASVSILAVHIFFFPLQYNIHTMHKQGVHLIDRVSG